jgi:hypothetical protein
MVLYHRQLFALRDQLEEFSNFDFYGLLASGCGPNTASFQTAASISQGTWKCTIAGGVNSKKIRSGWPKKSIASRDGSHESPPREQVTNMSPGNRFSVSCSCSAVLTFRTFQRAVISGVRIHISVVMGGHSVQIVWAFPVDLLRARPR